MPGQCNRDAKKTDRYSVEIKVMSFTIKQLDHQDINLYREMLGCFASEFEDPDTYLSNPPGDEYVSDRLNDPNFIALTALNDGQLIGALAAYELKKFEQARSEIYIYDLAVAKAFRRNGVATALIDYLKPIARKRQAWVIYVQADYGDDPAVNLYSKLGVREDVLHFDIAPDQSSN